MFFVQSWLLPAGHTEVPHRREHATSSLQHSPVPWYPQTGDGCVENRRTNPQSCAMVPTDRWWVCGELQNSPPTNVWDISSRNTMQASPGWQSPLPEQHKDSTVTTGRAVLSKDTPGGWIRNWEPLCDDMTKVHSRQVCKFELSYPRYKEASIGSKKITK